MRTIAPLLRRRGTSLVVGVALRRAAYQLDRLLMGLDRADALEALAMAIKELEAGHRGLAAQRGPRAS